MGDLWVVHRHSWYAIRSGDNAVMKTCGDDHPRSRYLPADLKYIFGGQELYRNSLLCCQGHEAMNRANGVVAKESASECNFDAATKALRNLLELADQDPLVQREIVAAKM